MDWTRGYTSLFEVHRMNVDSWAPYQKVKDVQSFAISRTCDETVPLLETATMEIDDAFEDGWYQLSMIVDQGSVERQNLGVFLFEKSGTKYDYNRTTTTASGYSVLKPADDRLVVHGLYALKGSNGAEQAALMLRECTPAPVVVHGKFDLAANLVFDVGMTYLAAVWLLLDAGGFCIQISGDGTINIMPKPIEASIELSRYNAELLLPGVQDDQTVINVPNRYYAIDGDRYAVAVNNNPTSIASYISRGRWVDAIDNSPAMVNGESLQEYAERKLKEATTITKKVTYSREYYPGVVPFSLVSGSMPEIGLDGYMMVITQSLTCDKGVYVQETAAQAVKL